MAVIKSLRKRMGEALVGSFLEVFDDWDDCTADNVGMAPTDIPQDKDFVSFRLMTFNTKQSLKATERFTVSAEEDIAGTLTTIDLVRSTIDIQAYGAAALTWLEVYLMRLEDDDIDLYFRDRGFSVYCEGEGISDISAAVGDSQEVRGLASIIVTCQTYRDRVIPVASTIRVNLDIDEFDETIVVDL